MDGLKARINLNKGSVIEFFCFLDIPRTGTDNVHYRVNPVGELVSALVL